jgi:hypothetical protein
MVFDSPDGGLHWVAKGIATEALHHFFAFGPILLCGECVGHICGRIQLGKGSYHDIEASDSNEIIRCCSSEFARAKEEEERDRYHIGDGDFVRIACLPIHLGQDENDDEDRDGLDSLRWVTPFLYALIWHWIQKSIPP